MPQQNTFKAYSNHFRKALLVGSPKSPIFRIGGWRCYAENNGNIDVDDGCWGRNALVTILRCLGRFWPFWSPTSTIFLH